MARGRLDTTPTPRRLLTRLLAAGPIGALIGVGLAVVPTTMVQAEVVHHTKAADVAGPLKGSEVRTLPFPVLHAALHWNGNPDAVVTVAFSTDGVRFGAPTTVEQDEVGMQRGDGETYGAILSAGGAIAARVTTDRPLGRLTVLALAEDGTSVVKTPVPRSTAGAAAVNVHPRSEWGADESLRFRGPTAVWPPVFQTVQKLVVHHTAGAEQSGEDAKATIRSIYYYHAVTQGWGDIGYNFLIDAGGVVYKGRSTSSTKADVDVTGENADHQGVTAGHAFGHNSGTVGVALLGNFVDKLPTSAAETGLSNFLVGEASAHGLDTAKVASYTNPTNGVRESFENVPGHAEVPNNATECPGGVFLDRLTHMRDEMKLVAATPDNAAPAAPASLSAKTAKRVVTVAWPAVKTDTGSGGGISGVAGYDVYRRSLTGELSWLASTTATTYSDSAPARGANTYVVETFDGAANRSVASVAAVA